MPAHTFLEPDEVETARRHANHLVNSASRLDQLRRELVLDAAEFADGPIWIIDGAPSAARWLSSRLGVLDATVREWIRVGRALRALHATAVAWAEGRLSFAKVRTLTRIATPDNENVLLVLAERHTANDLARAIAAHLTETDPTEADRMQHRRRSITIRQEPDGMVTLTARLPPVEAGTAVAAIDTRMMRSQPPREPDGTWPTVAQRRADALIDTLREPGTFEVLVHVTGDGNHLADGSPVNEHAVTRLLGDAVIRALVTDAERRPVNASTNRRHPTLRQSRVVAAREIGCIDCGRTELLEDDHEPAYAQTGRTHTDELHRRCGPCHTRRHAAG